ncbi:class I SAM-dependent RNA methyltransferase [Thalassococcus sp. CAU 1522]|uniref:Class I SAM-dependent RNA methyltransferase n=1 Tax=Thalassococcus arenae TaxID=2851652 RepID=A0ABS6N6P9_9RHOB|nr:class I SAM-dependent RNA methyltransferase [Thalassococcus arenae]MBV2359458.1 class I SAM-dependent RNA methyltransferase [Thalassococcus arenae]
MNTFVIERLGHQGDGIAQGPVYVPGALPGEVVSGVPDGQILGTYRIETPSPDRVSPPCRHARSCGGCQLQHAADSFVEAWKQDVVGRALIAQGVQVDFRPCFTAEPQSRRRASFAARRTKKGALVGFHQKASDIVVAVPDCLLITPALRKALPMVERLAVLGASRKHALSVQITDTAGGLDVAVSGGKPMDAALQSALADLARDHDLARLFWDGEGLTRRPPHVDFGGITVVPPPGAFLQATADGEATLRNDVLEIVDGARHVVDLFAGCGTFALPVARSSAVHAVEGDKAMLVALDAGWRQGTGLRKVTHQARDLFRNPLLPDELARFDAAIIDPPRAGAEAQTAALARARIPRIAFVSCNPVSFARDAATLTKAGYRLNWVRVVDQFRWSTHVELVAAFQLED